MRDEGERFSPPMSTRTINGCTSAGRGSVVFDKGRAEVEDVAAVARVGEGDALLAGSLFPFPRSACRDSYSAKDIRSCVAVT